MGVDSLEETKDDPEIYSHNMEVLSEVAVEEGSGNGTRAENGDLQGMSVFSSQAEWCRVLVVELVDIAVKGAVVESLMSWKKRIA